MPSILGMIIVIFTYLQSLYALTICWCLRIHLVSEEIMSIFTHAVTLKCLLKLAIFKVKDIRYRRTSWTLDTEEFMDDFFEFALKCKCLECISNELSGIKVYLGCSNNLLC